MIKTYNQFTIDQQLKVSSRQVGENVVEKEEKGAKNDYLPHKGDIHSISTKVSEYDVIIMHISLRSTCCFLGSLM